MATVKTQPDMLLEISEKLDCILGFMAVKGIEDDLGKAVTRLRNIGLGARAIARVTGISENAVAIRLTRLKQAEKRTASKAAGKKRAKSSVTDSHEGSDGESDGVAE